MPQATSSTDAAATRRQYSLANGTGYWRSEFHRAAADGPAVQPQAFLVEQEPDSTILPHFHVQNQFQIIVAGGGRLGKHPVRPVSVHYAGAHTPYGPIVSGPEGLSYFTLRDGFDPGARFMPGARAELARVRRRFLLADELAVEPPEALRSRRGAAVETVIAPEADGLAAMLLRAGPEVQTTGPDPAAGGGQYHLVLAGTLRHERRDLPVNSCLFVARGDPPPGIAAGPEGLQLLILQFPHRHDGAA